jgi:hypothetical protein
MSFTTITGLINTVIDNISKNLQNYYKEKRINWEKHRDIRLTLQSYLNIPKMLSFHIFI